MKTIDDSVKDVLKIAAGDEPFEKPCATEHTTVHHIDSAPRAIVVPHPVVAPIVHPTVVPVPVPVAKPYYVPKAVVPAATAPNSSVMRAIADANEAAAADKVKDQRDVANKMEKLEGQAKINQAINESVKKEE